MSSFSVCFSFAVFYIKDFLLFVLESDLRSLRQGFRKFLEDFINFRIFRENTIPKATAVLIAIAE